MKTLLTIVLAALLAGPIQFDKTVHDFGEISTKAGKQTCTFTVTNDSEDDLSILAVVPSCGCTDVVWPRETIAPGKSGKITATYSNDEGVGIFDKTLTVYPSAQKKPIILHLKGSVTKNAK